MKVLLIASDWPKPDQASGDFRLVQLLTHLARSHDVLYCAAYKSGAPRARTDHCQTLEGVGVKCGAEDLLSTLRQVRPDIVWFEFFHQVRHDLTTWIRHYLTNTRIIVDSVDVHFGRLMSKARLSALQSDAMEAERVKSQELAAYAQADTVIAVSPNDAALLSKVLPHRVRVDVVPNVHPKQPFVERSAREFGELMFIGGFNHPPNVDGILHFRNDIFPKIRMRHPNVCLRIIGSNMPDVVRALAEDGIEIIGYVPDTSPYLRRAYISVAPLRFGGGMKGKVGEAMAYGLPVVTTPFGAEGFGAEANRDLLVANSTDEFVDHVSALLADPSFYELIARNGYDFVSSRFGVERAGLALDECLAQTAMATPQTLPLVTSLKLKMRDAYARHVAWRFNHR